MGSHGVGECLSFPGFYLAASLNGHKLYTVVLDEHRKVSFIGSDDMGARLRSITPLDDCHVLILTEITNTNAANSIAGPLIRKNVCGRERFYGDPSYMVT